MAGTGIVVEETKQGEARRVDQLLHGYAGGHRLLDGSTEIDDGISRQILRLSDLSGPNVSRGFEEYITGYPLPSIDSYALAKTWYATEMPRPGCVWTHTLIVPAMTLAAIAHLELLSHLFRRPGSKWSSNQYSHPLRISENKMLHPTYHFDHVHMSAVLASHYAADTLPVLLPARTSEEYESLIFALWSQKWPSLRLSFTFCTGALSARFVNRTPLDIQCVPISSSRQAFLDVLEVTSVAPLVVEREGLTVLPWVEAAAVDARIGDEGSLRSFLWRVSDESIERADFASLVDIHQMIERSFNLTELVDYVGSHFPSRNAGGRLKALLFGVQKDRAFLRDRKDSDILLVLATTSRHSGFDGQTLAIQERGARLWSHHQQIGTEVLTELFRSNLNPLGEELLAGMVAGMEPDLAQTFVERHPQFLPALFEGNARLACSRELWRAGRSRRRELLEAVFAHRELEVPIINCIVAAILESGCDSIISLVVARWGATAVGCVLDWMNIHDGALSDPCREALRTNVPFVLIWLGNAHLESFRMLLSVLRVLDWQVANIAQLNSTIWLESFRKLQSEGTEHEIAYAASFLLALALNDSPPTPLELATESFQVVHEAARTEQLADEAWFVIEPFIPTLSWGKNWDKCERLRRGLIRAFVRFHWPFSEISRVTQDRVLLSQLAKSSKRVDGAEIFAANLEFWTG